MSILDVTCHLLDFVQSVNSLLHTKRIRYSHDKTRNGIKYIAWSDDAQKIAVQFSDSRVAYDNRASLPAR